MKGGKVKILSIHWGLSIGGVGKYASVIDNVDHYSRISIKSLCILNKNRHIDENTLQKLKRKMIVWRSSIHDLSWIWAVKNDIDTWKPSLIMTHGFNGHFITLLLQFLFKIRIPLICSYHGQYHATTPARKIFESPYNWFTEWTLRNQAIGIISVADFFKQYLISKKISEKKIQVIHNGIKDCQIPDDIRNSLRKEWGVKNDEILLGVASRIDPVKGIAYLVGSFITLAPRYENIKLIIIGTGSLDQKMKDQVSYANLNHRVIFTGFRTDIENCLIAFDIFILPSLAEYHSIALIEAMRAGKAIVTTEVGGNTESVRNEKEGLVVPPADSISLAAAIKKLLNDTSLRISLGRNARQRFLENFTIDQTIQNTAKWIIQCKSKL
jgi:glycosyltransferase involved in cell wall biosynthesis